jgi:hypothetical protein
MILFFPCQFHDGLRCAGQPAVHACSVFPGTATASILAGRVKRAALLRLISRCYGAERGDQRQKLRNVIHLCEPSHP